LIEYHSTSSQKWITAKVLARGQDSGTYDLDCKTGVHVSRLRPLDNSAESAPGTMIQGCGTNLDGFDTYPGNLPPAKSMPGDGAKLDRLRRAVAAEDPVELRNRMESVSALGLVGEELDHASHQLWILEARPQAQKDLKKAMAGKDIDNLQMCLEAAAAVGLPDHELEMASERLWQLKVRQWRYAASDGRHLDLRKEPDVDGPRVGKRLNVGDVFDVSEEIEKNGINYLRLADGSGWAFEDKPGVGILCVRVYADEYAQRSQRGSKQFVSLTIADLRRQHQRSTKMAKYSAPAFSAISEEPEDSPGAYLLVDDTALTPTADLCSASDIVTTLHAGTVVNVLEVVHKISDKRIRGRINNPSRGWISLLDTSGGKRWAEKQSYLG